MFNKKLIDKVSEMNFDNPVTQVHTDLEYAKSSVSSFLSGKIKASKNFLNLFAKHYEVDLNDITDPEENIVSVEKSNIVKSISVENPKKHSGLLIPFYDIDFASSPDITTMDNNQVQPDYYMDVPEFSGCKAFRAYSDSMEKLIKSGSILFGTKVEEWNIHLEYGQIYGIICNDGRRYLKYIRRHLDNHKEWFLLKSENESYDDFDIPKIAIRSVWLIHGWLNKRT